MLWAPLFRVLAGRPFLCYFLVMKQSISAGIIIFRCTKDGLKYLLLYRGRNYWNFPKGKLEGGERSFRAALREVREETGLKPSELKFQSHFKAFERFIFQYQQEKIFRVVILYLAETSQTQIRISGEHEGFGWFTLAEAHRVLTKHKETLAILKRAHTFVRARYQGQGQTSNRQKPLVSTSGVSASGKSGQLNNKPSPPLAAGGGLRPV